VYSFLFYLLCSLCGNNSLRCVAPQSLTENCLSKQFLSDHWVAIDGNFFLSVISSSISSFFHYSLAVSHPFRFQNIPTFSFQLRTGWGHQLPFHLLQPNARIQNHMTYHILLVDDCYENCRLKKKQKFIKQNTKIRHSISN